MATFERAHLTVLQSLEFLRDATKHNFLKQSLIQTIQAFHIGMPLSQALACVPDAFDALFCSMVEAGEKTGNLAITFDQLAQLFKWRYGLKSQIWKSLQYPVILSAVVLALIGLMFSWMIPQMAELFISLQKELPFSTRFLILISQHSAIIVKILLSLVSVLFSAILTVRFLSYEGTCKIHQLYLKLPFIGNVMQKVNVHRFLQVFVSLLKANVSLIVALEAAAKNVQNHHLQRQFFQVRQGILTGLSLSQSWQHQSNLDPLIGRLMLTGEHTGQLSHILNHGIDFLKRDIDQFSKQCVKALEPILIIILGTVLGWIVVAIFLPLYQNLVMLE